MLPAPAEEPLKFGPDFLEFTPTTASPPPPPEVPEPSAAPGRGGGFDLDAAAAIHSTPPATVFGTVVAGSQPVDRALVRLVSPDGGRRKRRRTDAEGHFEFANVVPDGDYRVRARRRGVGIANAAVYVDLDQLSAEAELRLTR